MASRVFPSESDALESIIWKMLAQACFAVPGIVEEFKPGPPPIARVIPAIERKVMKNDKAEYVKMPVIMNVPVVVPFAQTAGLLITLPIRKDDEGLIVFADRMIDNFVEKGGFQPPECCGPDNLTTEPRAHHLTDAIFIPGIIAKKKWGEKIVGWNLDAVEIRNLERTCFFSMNKNCNITIQTTGNTNTYCNNATVNAMSSVNISGNGGVRINESSASNVTAKGNCCCAGSCSSDYRDGCCGVTQQGNMCCNGACSPGATSNCMNIDDLTGNLKLRIPNVNG